MFKNLCFLFSILLSVAFIGCAQVEKEPTGSIMYFRNIVAKADAVDVAGYAPVTDGTQIACIKNGTKAEAKLKITAQARFTSNILIKNTKFLIKSVTVVFTKKNALDPDVAGVSVTGDPLVTIDFDQSADLTVTIRNINSAPATMPDDAIYKYTLTFDVIGTERLLGQADYTGVFTALWGSFYIVGKNVDCAEAIKK